MIHETAEVYSDKIGENTDIWQFSVVLKEAVIGKHCNINCNVFIENDVIVGDYVTVKSGVQLWDGLRIENNVFIGPNVTFTNDLIPKSKHYPERFLKTYIEEGASIGANSTIIAGNTIGKFALIGAGSVITKPIPPFSLWYGNPASHKGFITREGKILDLNLTDENGKEYSTQTGEPLLL